MAERKFSERIANAIINVLTDKEIRFRYNDGSGIFRMEINISGGLKVIDYFIAVREEDFIIYITPPIDADPENKQMMTEMAKFICRINYGLLEGNFELNMADGGIRYKCFVDCDEIFPSENMIWNSISIPAYMFEKFGKGMVVIIYTNATAQDAAAMCEREDES